MKSFYDNKFCKQISKHIREKIIFVMKIVKRLIAVYYSAIKS